MRAIATSLVLGLSLWALPAAGQQAASAGFTADTSGVSVDGGGSGPDEGIPGSLVVGGELGGIFPQPFSELGTHVVFGVEVGYRLPMWEQRLEIMFDAGYSPPGNSFETRRADGTYEGEIDQQELHFSLGPRGRLNAPSEAWNLTGALGGRLFLLRTTSSGSKGGQEFMEYTEQSTQFGFFVALGGEYNLGPGAIFLDLDLGWADLPHKITGDTSTGNIAATLGYRFFLL
jgi:hypothetical protein